MENRVKNALRRAGLEFSPVELTGERRGLMVLHDYAGLYPTREALERGFLAKKIAYRYGLRAEDRGHKQATLIYL